MNPRQKPLVWVRSEIKSPPLSAQARLEAGYLLRRLQRGEVLGMPHSRPMPIVGRNCHELRLNDVGVTWRVIYRIDADAIVIVGLFSKKTARTPSAVIETSRRRLQEYDDARGNTPAT